MLYIQNNFKKGLYDLISFNADLRGLGLLNVVEFKQFSNNKVVLTVRGDNYRINNEY